MPTMLSDKIQEIWHESPVVVALNVLYYYFV